MGWRLLAGSNRGRLNDGAPGRVWDWPARRYPALIALDTNSVMCYYACQDGNRPQFQEAIMAIENFRNRDTEAVFRRYFVRSISNNLQRSAHRKLVILHNAIDLNDLRTPPGNRLELLSGDRNGQYSIRINDQWRICFVWSEGNAYQVEIVDYH